MQNKSETDQCGKKKKDIFFHTSVKWAEGQYLTCCMAHYWFQSPTSIRVIQWRYSFEKG